MPKIDNKVFCINHPDEEMNEFDGKFIIPNTNKDDDGKFRQLSTAFIGRIYRCEICQYIELYSISDDEAAV